MGEDNQSEQKSPEEKILDTLFNKDFKLQNDVFKEIILKQYEIYVKMSNDLSERREKLNAFFLTANGLLLTAFGFLAESNRLDLVIIPLIIGFIFSLSWWSSIRYYKELNSAKFKIINKIEKEKLVVQGFYTEWELFKENKTRLEKKLRVFSKSIHAKTLSEIVRLIPLSLSIIYLGLIVLYFVFGYFNL